LTNSDGYAVPKTKIKERHVIDKSSNPNSGENSAEQQEVPDWCWNYQTDLEEIQSRSITIRDRGVVDSENSVYTPVILREISKNF
jgi:hypothetical protein